MKKVYSFLFLTLSCGMLFSQMPVEKCAVIQNHLYNAQNDPAYLKRINDAEVAARQWLAQHKSQKQNNTTLLVPVVFHCVYKSVTDPSYLHDSVFARQIAILNETYSKSNPNYVNTRPIFDSLGANTDIQFCLAGTDPQGNPTNGIDRFLSSKNWLSTSFDNSIKVPSKGGVAPWDPQRYLNIWTCDMKFFGQPFVLGVSSFPGGPDSLDGITIEHEFIGYQNQTTTGVNNLGKTAVHECGHWFGMRHIWGDGQNASNPCDSTDYVEDTPRADSASSQTCLVKNTCSSEDPFWSAMSVDPPDMVENYMDYSSDACMTMFTKGQKARMWSFINTIRANLLTNNVTCTYVGIDKYNAAFGDYVFVYPNPSAGGNLNINFSTNSIDGTRIDFYNSAGQLVKTVIPGGFQNVLDVKDLASGIYFIKIANANNCTLKKIVLE